MPPLRGALVGVRQGLIEIEIGIAIDIELQSESIPIPIAISIPIAIPSWIMIRYPMGRLWDGCETKPSLTMGKKLK
jgi:hypothetical protein